MNKRLLYLLAALGLVLIFAATAKCQEAPRVSFSAQTVVFSDGQETFLDANGRVFSQYDYRVAPIRFNLDAQVSDSFRANGRLTYAGLYDIQNPPSWAFSPNSTGTMYELEGSLSYLIAETAFVRGGFSMTNLERTLSIFTPQNTRAVDVTTRYVAPFVGAGIHLDGQWILRAAFDFYPILVVSDSYSQYINGSSINNRGFRTEISGGFRFTDHLAVIAGYDFKKLKARDNFDGPDGSRQLRNRQVTAGIQLAF